MLYKKDTICAISTPPGNGAIAIIRISGEDAITIADSFFKSKKKLTNANSHTLSFGKFINKTGKIIDEVLVSIFKAPKSYTGENMVEISCHGSNFIANNILEVLLTKARLANPGEFTERAFFNDKMDLTQAEAVGDLLMAKTYFSHLSAINQLEGSIHKKIDSILKKLTAYRTLLELEIDFSEQDLPDIDMSEIRGNLINLKNELYELVENSKKGIILKDGLKISLVGAPNVGKSSIFNKMLKTERAIVTPIPGTTRDFLEEAISLDGYLIRIFDTAGLRNTDDSIERIGIERSYDVIQNSDIVLYITDKINDEVERNKLLKSVEKSKIINVFNKSDLFKDRNISSSYILCNTIKEGGLSQLKEEIKKRIDVDPNIIKNGMLSNARQLAAAQKALESIEKSIDALESDLGFEFIAFDLKEASSALEEIIGKITSDDILNGIFANFCIGK